MSGGSRTLAPGSSIPSAWSDQGSSTPSSAAETYWRSILEQAPPAPSSHSTSGPIPPASSPTSQPSKSKAPARLTVVDSVNHQILGEAPFSLPTRFTRELMVDERPYDRTLKGIREGWVELERGW